MESGVTDGDRADPQSKGCCVPTLAPRTEGLKENETGVAQDGATRWRPRSVGDRPAVTRRPQHGDGPRLGEEMAPPASPTPWAL